MAPGQVRGLRGIRNGGGVVQGGLGPCLHERWPAHLMIPDGLEPSFSGCRPGVVAAGPRDRSHSVKWPLKNGDWLRRGLTFLLRMAQLPVPVPLFQHDEVDPPGIAPGSPVCRTGVFLLDHGPHEGGNPNVYERGG